MDAAASPPRSCRCLRPASGSARPRRLVVGLDASTSSRPVSSRSVRGASASSPRSRCPTSTARSPRPSTPSTCSTPTASCLQQRRHLPRRPGLRPAPRLPPRAARHRLRPPRASCPPSRSRAFPPSPLTSCSTPPCRDEPHPLGRDGEVRRDPLGARARRRVRPVHRSADPAHESAERAEVEARRDGGRPRPRRRAHREFMDWAEGYEDPDFDGRNRVRHEAWLAELRCPVLRLDSRRPVDELVSEVVG